jgi:small subunit ribosomal protein S9
MSDETNETSEQPVDETTEGQEAATAGPVAEGAPSSSQAAGEDAPSVPPADEEPQAEGSDAGPTEEAADTSEVAEEAAPEPEPAPAAKEEKKDVIPGANLEPIAIEPDGPALSAEERARLEAEEEEKRNREAALAAAETDSEVADRAPAKMEKGSRFLATGKRKNAIARVILLPGDGKFTINGRALPEFLPRPLHQTMVKQPLTVSGYEGSVDVRVRVHGGGVSGQAGAIRHGIARALTEIDAELRGDLKRRGFLTRDARVKERRKAGFKKARKKPQFSKR